jgi:hypothetical protein
MRKATLLTLIAIAILSSANSVSRSHPTTTSVPQTRPSAEIRGRTIYLKPSNSSFEIPEAWVNLKSHNLHLTVRELNDARTGVGEWDAEYSRVVNATLPFEMCAAHVGNEGWGKHNASLNDLQTRVYVMANTASDTFDLITRNGLKEALKISTDASLKSDVHDKWQMHTITYSVFYFDYGGTAAIDFYYRPFGNQTVVFVFMRYSTSDYQDTMDDILNSFKWTVRT